MDISDLAQVLADIDLIQIRAGSTMAGMAYDELAREIMHRAGRTFWTLTYHAETGPDSEQGGYDTPADAQNALYTQRLAEAGKPRPIDGGRWAATRQTVVRVKTDEDW